MKSINDLIGFIRSKEGDYVVYNDNGHTMAGYIHTGDPREERNVAPFEIFSPNADGVYGYTKDNSFTIHTTEESAEPLYRFLREAKAPFLSYRSSEDPTDIIVRIFEKDENGNASCGKWVELGKIEKTIPM